MRPAIIGVLDVEVYCPSCEQAQPNPDNEGRSWTVGQLIRVAREHARQGRACKGIQCKCGTSFVCRIPAWLNGREV